MDDERAPGAASDGSEEPPAGARSLASARRPAELVKAPSTRLAELETAPRTRGEPSWTLAELSGRLVELAGWRSGAALSSALELVVDAQKAREPAVWVGPRSRTFFPPDAERAGVDLAALAVVRVGETRELSFSADVLARSGAFGLVVLDLGRASLSLGMLSRLAGLARAHEAAIVLLTEKPPERPSLGSVVSLRADASFARREEGGLARELDVVRDRIRGKGWRLVEARRGPPGLP